MMKKFNALLVAAILAFQLAPALAELIHRSSGVSSPTGVTDMNLNGITLTGYPFLNVANSLIGGGSADWPNQVTAAGYPTSDLTVSVSAPGLGFIPNYYGHWKIWWTGTGALSISTGPWIIYNGGAAVGGGVSPSNSGVFGGNIAFGFNGVAAQPRSGSPAEFAFGALISAVSNAGTGACGAAGGTSGLVCLTSLSSGFFGNLLTSQSVQVNFVNNLSIGPWTIRQLDTNHIQLQGSTYNGTMSINSGVPGVQSEVIYGGGGYSSWSFPAQGSFSTSYSGFGGMVICRSQNVGIGGLSDCANAGTHYVNIDYINVLKAANPRWVRWMDEVAVQGSFATSFAARPVVTNLSWGENAFYLGYWSGDFTNVGDAYTTTTNPTASPSSGPPVDGEVVEAYAGTPNTTTAPTLTVNRTSFGSAKPILGSTISGLSLFMSGSIPATGTIISWVFTGGGLPSAFTYRYGINQNSTNTFTGGTGGAASTALTISAVPTGAVTIGQILNGFGFPQIIGNSQVNSGLCSPSCTGVNGTGTYALSSSVTITNGTSISGLSPNQVFTSNATPDTNLQNITNNIRADISHVSTPNGNASALNTAGIGSENPEPSTANMTFGYNPNINSSGVAALGNGLTITGSDSASSITFTFGYVDVGAVTGNLTLTYSALAGGWISRSPGITGGLPGPQMGFPLEYMEDFSIQAGVGMWLNLPILYSDAAVTSTCQHIGNAGVRELAIAVSNETWNNGPGGQFHILNSLAAYLAGLGGSGFQGYTGLRFIQVTNACRIGWANAGRSQSQLLGALEYQFVNPNVSQLFNGSGLTPGSNVTLAAYGGSPSNGTTTPGGYATNSSVFPNRPRDWADFLSPAVYFVGNQLNGSFIGPLTNYGCSLVASYNYNYGNSSEKTAALNFLFNGTSGDFYTTTGGALFNNNQQLAAWAHGSGNSAADYFGITTIVAADDASRTGTNPHTSLPWQKLGVAAYEGDQQGGPISPSDISNLNGAFVSAGDTNGYTSGLGAQCGMTPTLSGPGSTVGTRAGSDASNMAGLMVGFKNSSNYKALYLQYFNDFVTAVNSQGTRLAGPGTYGFEDNGASWSKYPNTIYGTAFKSESAICQFNGGSC